MSIEITALNLALAAAALALCWWLGYLQGGNDTARRYDESDGGF
jgi:hypothetical protein